MMMTINYSSMLSVLLLVVAMGASPIDGSSPSTVRALAEATSSSTSSNVINADTAGDFNKKRLLDSSSVDSADSFYGPANRSYPSRDNTGSTTSRQGKSKNKSNDKQGASFDDACSSAKGRSGSSKGRSGRSGSDDSRSGVSGGKGGRRERGLKGKKRGKNKSGVSSVSCATSSTKSGVKGVPDREYPSDFASKKATGGSSNKNKASVAGVACDEKGASGTGSASKKRRQRVLKGSRGGAAKGEAKSGVTDGCIEGAMDGADYDGGPSREYPPAPGSGGVGDDDRVPKGEGVDGVVDDGDSDESSTESSTTTSAMATAEGSGSSTKTDKRVGFTMGMLGLVLVSLVAIVVGVRRKKSREQQRSKAFYADMDDDEGGTVIGDNASDADTFVYPTEEELVGPEFGDLEFTEEGYHNNQVTSTMVLGDSSRKYSYSRRDDDVQNKQHRGIDSNFILDDLQGDSFSVRTPVSRNTCAMSRQSFNSVSTRNLQKKTKNTCCL